MAQLLDQFYVNSPNFPPLIREKKDAVRDVNLDLLPTKKQQKRKFNFQYTAPNDLFDEVVKDSRGSLISNDVLKKHVNAFYQKKFNNNLNAVYNYDLRLYSKLNEGDNFHLYEKYIYIISTIIYINSNVEILKSELNTDATGIIEWGRLRDDKSLAWRLEGPKTPTTSETDFVEHYNMLVATVNDASDLTEQTKVSKINMLYDGVSNLRRESIERPNSYNKQLDVANQYYIIIRDEMNLLSEIDTHGNLVFDASSLDLGDVAHNETQAQYDSIRVSQEKYKSPPSKMVFKSIQQLFTNFSSISVNELTFAYGIFKNDISKFSTVFLVFPGIHTSEHTVIGQIPRGVLRITGRFINDTEKRRYIFQPKEALTTFDGSQTFVHNLLFYITTSTTENDNAISGRPLMNNFAKTDVYNHVIASGTTEDTIQSTMEEIIFNDVAFEFPELSDIKDIDAYVFYLMNLEFVPKLIKEYIKQLKQTYNQYMTLVDEVGDYTPVVSLRSDNIISNSKIASYNRMKEIETSYNRIINILKVMNTTFSKYKSARITKDIYDALEALSVLAAYKNFILMYHNVIDFISIRKFISALCNETIDTFVDTFVEGAADKYLTMLENIVSSIAGVLAFTLFTTVIRINPFTDTTIDGLHFYIDNTTIIFTYSNEREVDYVTDAENDMILMRQFNDQFKQELLSSFVYSPSRNLIQWLPYDPANNMSVPVFDTDITILRRIEKKGDYYYMRGGFEVATDGTGDLFARLTEALPSYELATYCDGDRTLRFIKYLPQPYMNYTLIPLKIFDYVDNKIAIAVTNSRRLFIRGCEITIQMPNTTIDMIDPDHHYHFTFHIQDYMVKQIDIFFCHKRNTDTATSDRAVIKIETDPYASLYLDKKVDITSRLINLPFTIEDLAGVFRYDNCFKAYRCNENMMQKYWNKNSIRNGILIRPISDRYKDETDVDMIYKFKSNNCVIYTEDNAFHDTLMISNIIAVDGEATTIPVYVYETITDEHRFEGNTEIADEVTIDANGYEVKLEFKNGIITTIKTKDFTLLGDVTSEVFYSVENGTIMVRYDTSITEAIVVFYVTSLKQYLYVDDVIKCRDLYHFEGQFEGEDITSLTPINMNYHKTLPYFKYWQNILSSKVFSNNNEFQMVIRNDNNIASNVNITLQKYQKASIDTVNDMNIANDIPYTKKYISEQIDDKLVITGIKNNDLRSSNVISSGGYVTVYGEDMLYMSLNVK